MSDSESTEIYELTTDYAPKTHQDDIKKQNLNGNCYKKKEKSNLGKNKLGCKKQSLKCKTKSCMMILKSRKDLYQHHKTMHKGLHKCTTCDKQYKTPYSLNQHNYIHRRTCQLLICTKCKMTFAFKSQLAIHKSSHTKHGKFECSECFTKYKYKHDMYRHYREHTATTIACKKMCLYWNHPKS